MKQALIVVFLLSSIFAQMPSTVKSFGLNRIGFSSGSPSTGTWEIGDMISDNSSGGIKIWFCKSKGTFSSYSSSGKTVSGSPHIYEVASISGILIGQYATLSAGFSAGQKRVIAKSSHSGVTTSGATSSNGVAIVSNVSNVTSYYLGDYVQLSKGWPSTTCAYRITAIDTTNQTLTVDVAASSSQTGIAVTSVAAITVDVNATSTEATCNITTTDPTFGYFGSNFSDSVVVPNLKNGASGSLLTEIKVIDGANDTLSISTGGKTWKFLPVANQ